MVGVWPMTTVESTGHSRHLRDVLRAARERLGMSQREVAEAISERLDDERVVSSSAVSEWERFHRHPGIDVMAAWARVVGLRLIVDLDDLKTDRVHLSLRPRAAEVARLLDLLTDPDLQVVTSLVERLLPGKR